MRPSNWLSLALPLMLVAPVAGQTVTGQQDAHRLHKDSAAYIAALEDPKRDAYQKPQEVMQALAIKEGEVVADIGAGSGYFTMRLARHVGSTGHVYAVDVNPDMIRHLNARIRDAALGNVTPILAPPDDPKLPQPVDRFLIVDVWHHIDDRPGYLTRMKKLLKPGGQIIMIDFHKRNLPVGPPVSMKIAREDLIQQMTANGFRVASEHTFLPYQYFLVFERAAEDWPHWRGPSATGVSNEARLPVRWSEDENIAWKARLSGVGISSPIVWGDLVLVTSQAGAGTVRPGPRLVQGGDPLASGERPLGTSAAVADGKVTFLVSAFDRRSGRRVWEVELPAEGPLPSVHEKHNLASPSPVTDGERVYAWFATGQIAAIDLNGKLVWKKHLGAEYGPFEINWGHGSSPVVYKDQLILVCYHQPASYLLSLDSRTGSVRWKVDTKPGITSYSTPLVVETGGKAEIIVNSSVGVTGHDAATGERLWHFEEANRFPIPSPVFDGNHIYMSRGYRSSPFMALRPGGKGDVAASHVAWKVPSGAPYISSLVQYDGLIYMTGDVGVLTVADAKTGERVYQERLGGVYTASPLAGDGKVYLVSEDGETIVLSAGRSPRVLERNKLNARQLASPAIAGGRLFIRSDDTLYAIGK